MGSSEGYEYSNETDLEVAIMEWVSKWAKEKNEKFQESILESQKEFLRQIKMIKPILMNQGKAMPDFIEVLKDHLDHFDVTNIEKLRSMESIILIDSNLELYVPKISMNNILSTSKKLTEEVSSKLDNNQKEKQHSQKTRTDLEPKYRFWLLDQLGFNTKDSIFQNQKLGLNQRAELLSKIIGYNKRDCKDLLNGTMPFDKEKVKDLEEYIQPYKNKAF